MSADVSNDEYDYDDWAFTFLEYLPTVHECVLAIVHHAPNYGGKKQKDHIHQFALRLFTLWQKAFGRDVKLVTIQGIKDKLDRHLKEYRNKVQKGHGGSKRTNMIQWKNKHDVLFNIFGKGVNVDNFDKDENRFYLDQNNLTRKIKIDNMHVDVDHEVMVLEKEMQQKLDNDMEVEFAENEFDNVMDSTHIFDDSNLNFSVNRSGKIRPTCSTNEIGIQTGMINYDLREGCKKFKDSIKIALAASSSAANISPEAARVAFKVSTEKHFGVEYRLSADSDEPQCKRPHTSEEYSRYKDVLPTSKTIRKMKHLMAVQEERNAALALLDTLPSDVVTVHYDTTTRKRLNGEWPSLIIQTSSGKKFRLRSLNMAVEDRKNIVNLFLASLSRLALTVHCDKKLLWEKITAVMTDSVQKNLQIEGLIAASLLSTHIPLHLLCVSHTCEAFDAGNLVVLKHVEGKSDMKGKLLQRKPSLRSFLSKGVIIAVINALCKMVTNDGHKSSIHDEFDDILSTQNKSKKLSLYKERRFGLLGYSAAALLYHIDDLKATLDATNSGNQLVQACELYLQIDYVKVALQCLAWFTYKITLPFLNMCELETPKTLLSILPLLHNDLADCQMDTLKKYEVNYSFEVKKPESPLGTYIMDRFCKQAAIDLARQRGREYGFVDIDESNQRATDLTKVDDETAEKIPGHNLSCERDLSHMDKLAIRAAACSNRNFTASGMKDDMTLYQTNISVIEKETRSIVKLLDEEELSWFQSQKEITKMKLAEKRKKALHSKERSVMLLDKCKEHGGPFASIAEVENALNVMKDEKSRKKMLRNELLFRKMICKHDFQENPALYKVNSMSETEMKVNFGILLSGDHEEDSNEDVEFPDEDTILISCNTDVESNESDGNNNSTEETSVPLNEPCAVVWDTPSGREWYIGMTRSKIDNESFLIDFLERYTLDSTKRSWRYPRKEDEQITETIQIIPCNVIGAWDMTSRQPKFVVENWEIIEGIFQSMYK